MASLGRDKVKDILEERDLKDVVSVRLAIEKLLDVIENEESQEDGQTAVRALDNLVESAPSEVGAGELIRVIVSDRLDRLITSAEKEIPRGHWEPVAPYGESAQRILERIPRLVGDDHLRSVQRLRELCLKHARHGYGTSALVWQFGVPAGLASLELRRRDNGELTGRVLVEALIESGQSFSPSYLERESSRRVLDAALRFAGDEGIELLVQALRDDDVAVRRVAAVILPDFADERTLDVLLDVLSDNTYFSGTHRSFDTPLNPIPNEEDARRAVEAGAKQIVVGADVGLLSRVLQRGEGSAVHHDVIRALGRLEGKEGVEPLVGTLSTAATKDDRKTLVAVVKALEAIGSGATDALARLLGDAAAPVRAVAADVLGRIGDGRAVPALERCRHDDDEGVRGQVAAALERMGSR